MFHTYKLSLKKEEIEQALRFIDMQNLRQVWIDELVTQLRQAKKRCFRADDKRAEIYLTLCDGEIIDLTNTLDSMMHLKISNGIHPAVNKIYRQLIVHCG